MNCCVVYGPRHGEGCYCGGCQASRARFARSQELFAVAEFGRAIASLGRRLRGEDGRDELDLAIAELLATRGCPEDSRTRDTLPAPPEEL